MKCSPIMCPFIWTSKYVLNSLSLPILYVSKQEIKSWVVSVSSFYLLIRCTLRDLFGTWYSKRFGESTKIPVRTGSELFSLDRGNGIINIKKHKITGKILEIFQEQPTFQLRFPPLLIKSAVASHCALSICGVISWYYLTLSVLPCMLRKCSLSGMGPFMVWISWQLEGKRPWRNTRRNKYMFCGDTGSHGAQMCKCWQSHQVGQISLSNQRKWNTPHTLTSHGTVGKQTG